MGVKAAASCDFKDMNAADLTVALERPPIPFQWATTIDDDVDGMEEIVEGVLTAGGMSVWYGESNSGKTTLVLDLAMRMTAQLPWLGRRTVRGAVVYVAAESPGSVKRRLTAYRKSGGSVYAFGLVSCALNLLDPSADVEDLIDLIKDIKQELTSGSPLRLIVVDTVARVMGAANENAGEDMARLVSAGDRIREATGAHVLFVHHSGKDAAKGARGHSSLRAAVDTEVEVSVDGNGPIHSVHITKQRDLETKGLKLSARFVPVELGLNQWNNPRTTCIVEAVDEPSSHLAAVMRAAANERADEVALAGFRDLRGLGIKATDAPTSRDFLPSQLVKKGFAGGFTKEDMERALDRLMARGVFVRGVIGHYGNRTEKHGLVLSSEGSK